MRLKILLLSVVAFAAGFYMLSTPSIKEASAWSTTVHLSCDHAPWGNCPHECRAYHSCLTTPPPGGCGTERNNLCDCLQGINPGYDCTKIPNTVASIANHQQNIATFDQDLATLSIDLE